MAYSSREAKTWAKPIQSPAEEDQETPGPVRIAVLISNKGTGSNLQAIIDAREGGRLPQIEIGLVLSDASEAKGLGRAERHGLIHEVVKFGKREQRDADSQELGFSLNLAGIGIAVMAGWSRILTRPYFDTFRGVTINIHPGVLPNPDGSPFIFPDGSQAPSNKGLMTEKAVVNFLGGRYAGSTVHVATIDADSGPVLERTLVEVLPEDSVGSLYDRMKREEWAALVRALQDPAKIFKIGRRRVLDSGETPIE